MAWAIDDSSSTCAKSLDEGLRYFYGKALRDCAAHLRRVVSTEPGDGLAAERAAFIAADGKGVVGFSCLYK